MRHRITDWENNPGAHRDRELPDIVWIGPRPRRWRLPPGSLGWGVAHRPQYRVGQLSHVDWFAVTWTDHAVWRPWRSVDGVWLFVEPTFGVTLATWDRVHATGWPGTSTVFRESMDMEWRLGCI